MSWWNAKYKNGFGEYEITFASKDYEKAKVVEKVCQAIIDKRIKSPDELPAFLSGKGANVPTNADHIRSMTDEELAEWMAECNAYGEGAIASQWMPWLKQPYKE
ncbi:MAG: hypothetical protein IKY91_02610 [Akkermansia sp.]|nr:hypothetical protein [Akkermansia sp.]